MKNKVSCPFCRLEETKHNEEESYALFGIWASMCDSCFLSYDPEKPESPLPRYDLNNERPSL